jgi:DNA replication protein DnaC
MLLHPTVERLRALGLSAMAEAFVELQNTPDAAALPREDWLGLLVDREATSRENRKLARRLRTARLRQAAVVEDIDFAAPRGLDRALFLELASCHWLRAHQHLAIIGPTEPDSYCPSRYALTFPSHFDADRQTAAVAGGADRPAA